MSQINEILAKNLEYIKAYDEELCNRITSIERLTANIQVVYTALNEANLAINGIAINEQTGAQLEANRIINSLSHNNNASIHVVLGLGFGYLFSETIEASKGSVILYEPNIELLRVALEMVDLSQFLSKSRVFITSDFDMLEKHFGNCFLSNSQSAILACAYYKTHKVDELQKLIQKLSNLQGIYETNEKQRSIYGHKYTKNVCLNLFDLKNSQPIEILKDKFKNIPAIISAAGPSLFENIDILKKYRDKYLLFGVSTSITTLTKNNIIPDFVSIIEMFDASNIFKNLPLENISLIAEPYVNNNVINLPFKNKFITSSCENNANEIYSKFFNLERAYFETKGTVAYNALYSAMFFGCNPIILVGQDLAYIDGECYSKNSPLSPIKCVKRDNDWEVCVTDYELIKNNLFANKDTDDETIQKDIEKRIEALNKELVIGKTKTGEDVPTTLTFSLFSEYYKSFAKRFSKNIQLYNTSSKGIDLGEFNYTPLNILLETLPNITINKDLNTDVLSMNYNLDFLKNEIKKVTYICNKIEEVRPIFLDLYPLIKELKLTETLLKGIKLALSKYAELDKIGTQDSMIYREISRESKYFMNKVFDWLNELSIKKINRLWFNLKSFYVRDYDKLITILEILKNLKERLEDEISTTKG